jgi:hypothetical protein
MHYYQYINISISITHQSIPNCSNESDGNGRHHHALVVIKVTELMKSSISQHFVTFEMDHKTRASPSLARNWPGSHYRLNGARSGPLLNMNRLGAWLRLLSRPRVAHRRSRIPQDLARSTLLFFLESIIVRPIKLAKYPRMDKQTTFHSISLHVNQKSQLSGTTVDVGCDVWVKKGVRPRGS